MKSRAAGWVATPIASCLGLGYVPVAPGTAGSLGALAVAALLVEYRGWGRADFALLAGLSLAPGIWAAHYVATTSARKDPGDIVVDEAIGQWVTLAGRHRLQLEELAGGVFVVPVLRHCEASARAARWRHSPADWGS